MAPAKKTPSSKAPASSKPRAPRKTAITIRNLRGTVVHLRLLSESPKDPYRIELKPRGGQGDWTTVPAKLTDDPTLTQAIGVLIEVIPASQARELQASYAPIGYLGDGRGATVIRPEDATVSSADNWDGTGRRAPQDRNLVHHERGSEMNQTDREYGTGMHTTDVPGSDAGLHAQLKAAAQETANMGGEATPEGVDLTSRRVVIERVKGQ